jgi:hypothetical protein
MYMCISILIYIQIYIYLPKVIEKKKKIKKEGVKAGSKKSVINLSTPTGILTSYVLS